MDWFATIVSTLLIAVGGIHIFRPEWARKWDKSVRRYPTTDSVYKLIGFILLVSGIIYLVLFNYLAMKKN